MKGLILGSLKTMVTALWC